MTAPIRILVADDYAPFRRFVCSSLQNQPELQIIGEVSDGLEAVQKAQELQPDLILLDIGLPKINGIQAAWRIRELSPNSKIVFLTANRSLDLAGEALRTGASGYVVKFDAGSELLPAVEAVLQGKQFVSASLTGHDSSTPLNDHLAAVTYCHDVAFCADDISVVDGYARFIESALRIGHAVIVVVTEAHRASLLARLEADGVDVDTAIEKGSYIPLDAVETLRTPKEKITKSFRQRIGVGGFGGTSNLASLVGGLSEKRTHAAVRPSQCSEIGHHIFPPKKFMLLPGRVTQNAFDPALVVDALGDAEGCPKGTEVYQGVMGRRLLLRLRFLSY